MSITIGTDHNPYDPPSAPTTSGARFAIAQRLALKRGPAMPIAVGAFLGAFGGVLLLMHDIPVGYFGVFPGAVLGGLGYRFVSSSLPIDPGARRRRYIYATLSLVTLPAIFALLTGMRAQGLQMTIVAALIGLAFSLGILVSGDRRTARNVG